MFRAFVKTGGQYSHAAVWAVLAFVALGDGDTAGGVVPHAQSCSSDLLAIEGAALQS